jgi:hypothetical protein
MKPIVEKTQEDLEREIRNKHLKDKVVKNYQEAKIKQNKIKKLNEFVKKINEKDE